jgi:hypothetical protein
MDRNDDERQSLRVIFQPMPANDESPRESAAFAVHHSITERERKTKLPRRFIAWHAAEELSAIGCFSPTPIAMMLSLSTPFTTR